MPVEVIGAVIEKVELVRKMGKYWRGEGDEYRTYGRRRCWRLPGGGAGGAVADHRLSMIVRAVSTYRAPRRACLRLPMRYLQMTCKQLDVIIGTATALTPVGIGTAGAGCRLQADAVLHIDLLAWAGRRRFA